MKSNITAVIITVIAVLFTSSMSYALPEKNFKITPSQKKEEPKVIKINNDTIDLFLKLFPAYKEFTQQIVPSDATPEELFKKMTENKEKFEKILEKYNTDLGSFAQIVHRVMIAYSKAQIKAKNIPAELFNKTNFGNITNDEIEAVSKRLKELEELFRDMGSLTKPQK